jgi:hypothetical protein
MLALIQKRHMERFLHRVYGEKRPAALEVLGLLNRLCLQERDIEVIPFRYVPIPDERQKECCSEGVDRQK